MDETDDVNDEEDFLNETLIQLPEEGDVINT